MKEEEKEGGGDWFDRLYKKKPVRAVSLFVAVLTFITSFLLPGETLERWKKDLANICSDETGFTIETKILSRKTKNNKLVLKLELPEFSIKNGTNGEADSLRKIIMYKLMEYLKEDTLFPTREFLPANYSQLNEILRNYFPDTNYVRAIKVTLNRESIRPVKHAEDTFSGYLCITMQESSNTAYSDTLRLDYINFDREKMQVFTLDDMVEPIFRNYASTLYSKTLQGRNMFFNKFFFLPSAFYLTDKDICLGYLRENDTLTSYQGVYAGFEFRVPYDSLMGTSLIKTDGILKYLQ